MPEPAEYELDDDAGPPETEADRLARIQKEDEERARQLGLVKQRHSAATGRKWVDGIGGNSPNTAAARLLEQERAIAERKAQARGAAVKLAVVALGLALLATAIGAAIADHQGWVKLGLFPHAREATPEPAPVVTPVAQRQEPSEAVSAPGITVLGVLGESTPLDNPPSEHGPPTVRGPAVVSDRAATVDTEQRRRLLRKLEQEQRGVDAITADLAKKREDIRGHLLGLYGIAPANLADPERQHWRAPCAMLELEAASRAPRGNAAQWQARMHNAQAMVNNLTNYLGRDRKLEKDIEARLKSAVRRCDEARADLAASGP